MKEMVSVVMIGSIPKPRTYKRIAFLQRFSKMNLLCWDRVNETQLNVDESVDYPVHVIKLKAANDPLKRAVPYAKFTKKALKLLEEIQPDLIQVEGLDILKIADKYKRRSKKKQRSENCIYGHKEKSLTKFSILRHIIKFSFRYVIRTQIEGI